MKNNYSVSLVLPMFNERDSIAFALRNAVDFLSDFNPDSEIIIVDDGSIDRSFELVSELSKENPMIKCLRFDRNRGFGRALRAGLSQAKNELIVYTDSDWPITNATLTRAFDLLISERADLVVGCRRGKRELPYRKAYSLLYNFFIKIIFGLKLKDVNCPLKITYKRVIKDIVLRSDGPFIDVELLVRSRNKGCKIVELPYLNVFRKSGHSKFSSFLEVTRALLNTLREMLRFIFENNRTKLPLQP